MEGDLHGDLCLIIVVIINSYQLSTVSYADHSRGNFSSFACFVAPSLYASCTDTLKYMPIVLQTNITIPLQRACKQQAAA